VSYDQKNANAYRNVICKHGASVRLYLYTANYSTAAGEAASFAGDAPSVSPCNPGGIAIIIAG